MKICTGVELRGVIMNVKFKFEKFQGFWCHWSQYSPFPIDFARGPYHSAALRRWLWKHTKTLLYTHNILTAIFQVNMG